MTEMQLDSYKISLVTLFLMACVFGFNPVSAQDYPFRGGEKLNYMVHYRWGAINADLVSVDIACYEEEDLFHVRTDINTLPFWTTFYKMQDILDSYFSKDDLRPVKYHRDAHEGNFWAVNDLTWSDDAMSYHSVVDKKRYPHRDTVFSESVMVYDLVGLIYKLRNEDFEELLSKDTTLVFAYTMDRDIFDAYVKVVGKEEISVKKSGTFETIKVSTIFKKRNDFGEDNTDLLIGSSQGGEYDGKDAVLLWLTDDSNRLPVKFSASVTVGRIEGRITTYSGLKYR